MTFHGDGIVYGQMYGRCIYRKGISMGNDEVHHIFGAYLSLPQACLNTVLYFRVKSVPQ